MRQCARGLAAVLGGAVLTGGMVFGASAAPSDDEVAAIYELREQLVDALRDSKTELARYRAYRNDPRWYIVDEGWGYLDIERLPDYVPIARYIEDHPDLLAVLSTAPFWLDSSFVAAVTLLTDEATSSADVSRAAVELPDVLSQGPDEKAAGVRPYLRAAREERELTITAIDTLDALIEGMGVTVPGPAVDDVVVESGAEPAVGPEGVLAAYRSELMEDWTRARDRIRDCRAWIDDADTYIHDPLDISGFDLARLADFESAVEFIRDNDWAWAIFDAPAARNSDLRVATDLYLRTFEQVPDDLGEATDAVIEAARQTSREKRNDYCVEVLGSGKRHRDALAAALRAADEIAVALALVPEPPPRLATITPTAPSATPTPATPEPTTEPTSGPEPTPVPDPFAEL